MSRQYKVDANYAFCSFFSVCLSLCVWDKVNASKGSASLGTGSPFATYMHSLGEETDVCVHVRRTIILKRRVQEIFARVNNIFQINLFAGELPLPPSMVTRRLKTFFIYIIYRSLTQDTAYMNHPSLEKECYYEKLKNKICKVFNFREKSH